MKSVNWRTAGVIGGAVFVVAITALPYHGLRVLADATAALPQTLEAKTNREGTVSVTVTPRNLSRDAATWEFEISFNSHIQAVDQDITKAVVLIDAAGKAHAPISWKGDPPGGHHRKGLLRFRSVPGNPATVELQMRGIGGVDVRTFRWKLE